MPSLRNRTMRWWKPIAYLLCILHFSSPALANNTNPQPITTNRAKALTEVLLGHFAKGKASKALAMMAPTIQQTITAKHLQKQAKMRNRVLGPYRKGSLTLVSKLTLQRKTRFIWRAQFKREKAIILLLFDTKQQILGFVVQSQALLREMRKERPVSQAKQAQKQLAQLHRMADDLMRGFNQNQWALFCKHCSKVMKQVFTPKRFKTLRAVLHKRYGTYKSRRIFQVRHLVSLQNALVVRYKATFSKKQQVTLQFVFQRTDGNYRIAGWRIKM